MSFSIDILYKNLNISLRSFSIKMLLHSRKQRISAIPRYGDLQEKMLTEFTMLLMLTIFFCSGSRCLLHISKDIQRQNTALLGSVPHSHCAAVEDLHKTLGRDPPGKISMSMLHLAIQVTIPVIKEKQILLSIC